ncbi:unnamed protein product [Camellia sinensis]
MTLSMPERRSLTAKTQKQEEKDKKETKIRTTEGNSRRMNLQMKRKQQQDKKKKTATKRKRQEEKTATRETTSKQEERKKRQRQQKDEPANEAPKQGQQKERITKHQQQEKTETRTKPQHNKQEPNQHKPKGKKKTEGRKTRSDQIHDREAKYVYCSNMLSLFRFFNATKLEKEHFQILKKTPFFLLVDILSKKKVQKADSIKYDDVVAKILQTYQMDGTAFEIGGKKLKLKRNDFKLIFGIASGQKKMHFVYGRKDDIDLIIGYANTQAPSNPMPKMQSQDLLNGTSLFGTEIGKFILARAKRYCDEEKKTYRMLLKEIQDKDEDKDKDEDEDEDADFQQQNQREVDPNLVEVLVFERIEDDMLKMEKKDEEIKILHERIATLAEANKYLEEQHTQKQPAMKKLKTSNEIFNILPEKSRQNLIAHWANTKKQDQPVWQGSHHGTYVYLNDIDKILKGQDLAGIVIDAYTEHLLAQKQGTTSFVFISSCHYDEARTRMLNKIMLEAMKARYLLFPIHQNFHWTILVLDIEEASWKFYNSMRPRGALPKDPHFNAANEVRQIIEKYIKHENPTLIHPAKFEQQTDNVINSPQQDDTLLDCGILVCYIIRQYVSNKNIMLTFTKEECNQLRVDMLTVFLTDQQAAQRQIPDQNIDDLPLQ